MKKRAGRQTGSVESAVDVLSDEAASVSNVISMEVKTR